MITASVDTLSAAPLPENSLIINNLALPLPENHPDWSPERYRKTMTSRVLDKGAALVPLPEKSLQINGLAPPLPENSRGC